MSEMINKALSVARDLGLPVFPCRETLTKKGRTAKNPYTKNGFKDATSDEAQIRQWWRQHPNALIGVPTGEMSGIFVIDIDQSDGKNGEATFSLLGVSDPITCQTITVSGGRHLIFKYPEGHDLRNTSSGPLGEHIDTRGNGGYVIWAGSTSAEGSYSYREGFGAEIGFGELPSALLARLLANEGGAASLHFTGEIPNGQRNNTLFKEAVSLASKRVAPEAVTQHVLSRLQDCEGDFPVNEAEQILQSALSRGAANSPPFTDLGNAERFATDQADKALYCTDQRAWYCWVGNKWAPNLAKVHQLAKQTTRSMLVEALTYIIGMNHVL